MSPAKPSFHAFERYHFDIPVPSPDLRSLTQGARFVPCAHCGAPRLEPCRYPSGRETQYAHAIRVAPLRDMWRLGYRTAVEVVGGDLP